MIVVIYGPDAATAQSQLANVLHEQDPTGEATTTLDGRTSSLAEMINAVASVGLLTAKRVIVVRDVLSRAAKTGKSATAETEPAGERSPMIDVPRLLAAVPDQNCLIVVDSGVTALPAAVRKALPADARIIEAEPPRGQDLVDWLCRTAADLGTRLDARTARLLAERRHPRTWAVKPRNPLYDQPPDIELLRHELEKLALAAYPGPITSAHIEDLVATGDEDRLFPFVEATTTGRLAVALRELAALQDRGDEPHRITAQVFQQVELAAMLDAAGNRVDPAAVGQAIHLSNPKRMVALAAGRRGASSNTAGGDVAAALSVDRQSKRGRLRNPDDTLYELATAFAAALPAGRTPKRGG